jgi:hypothetical protein
VVVVVVAVIVGVFRSALGKVNVNAEVNCVVPSGGSGNGGHGEMGREG